MVGFGWLEKQIM